MSLKDKASLIFKPSRYKAGTAYSFRGTDFTFTRASTATRVNASGLIEDVASGVPRLSYDPSDLTKDPSLKLEPSRTNLVSQSQDFTAWNKSNCSVTSNSITSPEGVVNSFKITENSSPSTQHRVNIYIGASSGIYTISVYVKNSVGNRMAYIDLGVVTAHFNFLTETIYSAQGTAGFENAGNGWYRIWVTSNSAITPSCYMGLSVNNNETYSGDGTSAIEFFGAQIEAGAYPTTLIKTSGSAVTRAIDLAKKTSASSVIGQTEGTIYIEFEYTGVKEHYSPLFSLQGVGSPMELIEIYAGINSAPYSAVMQDGGVTQFSTSFTPSLGKNKVAFAYATNNSVLVVNGVVIGAVDTACTVPTLYDIGLGSFTYSSYWSLGNSINEALLFKQRLSTEELASLTSFDDYEELVDAKGLTWESPTITNNRLSELAAL